MVDIATYAITTERSQTGPSNSKDTLHYRKIIQLFTQIINVCNFHIMDSGFRIEIAQMGYGSKSYRQRRFKSKQDM